MGFIAFNCALIMPDAPNWLLSLVEIPAYIMFTYHSSSWTIANVVAYGFLVHFDDIILVTDSDMKKFCVVASVILVLISTTLDHFYPQYNTVTYYLFGRSTDMNR